MRININPFDLVKVFIVVAMLSFGLYQINITRDANFVATEASLLEAYSKTHTFYSQERHQTKTRYYFQYQYTFQDKVYTSKRYTHVNTGKALGVERFSGARKGTQFTVHVNPDRPAYAVVQKGQPIHIYVLALTGLIGALNCVSEWRLHRLLAAKPVKDKQQAEQLRKYVMITGAGTAIGIFASIVMYFFAI
jgi:hypothetical protein